MMADIRISASSWTTQLLNTTEQWAQGDLIGRWVVSRGMGSVGVASASLLDALQEILKGMMAAMQSVSAAAPRKPSRVATHFRRARLHLSIAPAAFGLGLMSPTERLIPAMIKLGFKDDVRAKQAQERRDAWIKASVGFAGVALAVHSVVRLLTRKAAKPSLFTLFTGLVASHSLISAGLLASAAMAAASRSPTCRSLVSRYVQQKKMAVIGALEERVKVVKKKIKKKMGRVRREVAILANRHLELNPRPWISGPYDIATGGHTAEERARLRREIPGELGVAALLLAGGSGFMKVYEIIYNLVNPPLTHRKLAVNAFGYGREFGIPVFNSRHLEEMAQKGVQTVNRLPRIGAALELPLLGPDGVYALAGVPGGTIAGWGPLMSVYLSIISLDLGGFHRVSLTTLFARFGTVVAAAASYYERPLSLVMGGIFVYVNLVTDTPMRLYETLRPIQKHCFRRAVIKVQVFGPLLRAGLTPEIQKLIWKLSDFEAALEQFVYDEERAEEQKQWEKQVKQIRQEIKNRRFVRPGLPWNRQFTRWVWRLIQDEDLNDEDARKDKEAYDKERALGKTPVYVENQILKMVGYALFSPAKAIGEIIKLVQ